MSILKNTDYFSNVLTLTKTVLEDSDIQKDKVLCNIFSNIFRKNQNECS
ncbi:hypothetical protein RV10_GL001150 [Enterococcus pallens]|nr:hypothetical protein RV10_GL001150 [Enterococcus pallens]